MKRKGIILIFLLCFICCKTDSESDQITLLQGAWFEANDENGAFLIKGRSLLFFEDTTQYNIKVREKYLEIYADNDLFTKYQITKFKSRNLWIKTIDGNTLKLTKEK